QILGRAKPQRQRQRGGIVNGPVQGGRGATVLQPGKRAGIELDQLAQGRGPRAAPAMLWSPARALRRVAERPAQAPHARSTDRQRVPLLQLLREMDIV